MTDLFTSFLQNTNSGQFELMMLLASFLGGVIASISPCSLAMLPIIIGYIGGYSKETPAKTLLQMIIFIFVNCII